MRVEKIGMQTLVLGDNMTTIPNLGQFHICLTDPPYGIDYGRAGGFSATHGWGQWRENVSWDQDRQPKEAFDMLRDISAAQVFWGGNYFTDYLPPSMRWLVWDKGQRDFSLADCEFAWVSEQKAARIFTYPRGRAVQDGKQHPTQKPLALMEWCLSFFPKAETVIDGWMGSGTTLVACQKLGRRGTGIEIDEEYWTIACERVHKAWTQPDLFISDAKSSEPVQERLFDE